MANHVPRIRKHKVKARLKAQGNGTKYSEQNVSDSNAAELIPSEQDARRKQLQAELRAQQPSEQISSKKRKRLDHYIDTKLQKEENLDLIKKLAAGQAIDTALLRSSKNLGRVKDTQRETLQRALQEREQGIDVERNEDILFDRRPEVDPSELVTATKASDHTSDEQTGILQRQTGVTTTLSIGSGLKRPLDQNEAGQPIVKRRRRKKKDKTPTIILRQPAEGSEDESATDDEHNEHDDDESVWGGFSDDDTANAELSNVSGMSSQIKRDDDSASEASSISEVGSGSESDSDVTTKDIVKTWKRQYPGAEDRDDHGDDTEESNEESENDGDTDDETSHSTSDSDSDSSNSTPDVDPAERVSAFKTWATQQRNTALGFTPSADTPAALPNPGQYAPDPANRPQTSLPRVPKFSKPTTETHTLSAVIPRTDEVQEARLKLPVVQEEQKIMETINAHPTTVIWGSTGSGKTTQIPQMLFESGYGSRIGDKLPSGVGRAALDRSRGMVGVTQPRRVAATSVAERVAFEMGPLGSKVGHQVRFDTTVSGATAIKFMTDGILLREIAADFLLARYSVIVLDEAHERSVNTDVLIGLLSRIVDLRTSMAAEKPDEVYPLKLVIMSATLRLEDFTQNKTLFRDGPPPVVKAEGRQFTVTEHFSKRTRGDYVEEMFKKVNKGHKQLPPGGMLVFLTGKDEIVTLSRRLHEAAAAATTGYIPLEEKVATGDSDHDDEVAINVSDLDESRADSDDDTNEIDEDKEFVIEESVPSSDTLKMHILPLHSQLPAQQQMKVFQPPPEGSRLIVLATNVAETSLTIPGIRYVFDCGRVKSKDFDPASGVQSFKVGYISKASAAQRAGRSGRTGPGHCYRLYSSAVFERDFEQNAIPDILRLPVENVALLIKSVDFPNVANFPFPTPPDRRALAKAEDLLRHLGAVDLAGKITDTGRALAAYPLGPRYARMILLAHTQGLLSHALALVASLAVPELILPPPHVDPPTDKGDDGSDNDRRQSALQSEETSRMQQKSAAYGRAQGMLSRWDDRADALKLLTAFALCSSLAAPSKVDKLAARCEEYFIRERAIKEAFELRSQLVRIAKAHLTMPESDLLSLPVLEADDRAKLKYIVASGYIDQIAVRLDHLRASQPSIGTSGRKPRRANEVPYRTLFPSDESAVGLSAEEREAGKNSYVHSSSLLARLSVAEMPTYIVYSHLSRAAIKVITAGPSRQKTRLHPLCVVTARQLVALAEGTPLLEVGKPIGKIEQMARGDDGRERRGVWVGLALKGKDDTSWPVGTRKEVQVRKDGNWVTERVVG